MSVDVYSTDWLLPRYGMMAHDYADVWPELTEELADIYRNRLGNLPWLPADWKASVLHLHGRDGKLLVPVSSLATANNGQRAKFLDTPEKKQIWDTMVQEINAARVAFADKQRQKGLYLMRMFQNQTAFWDAAYKVANVAALPYTVTKGVVETASDTAETFNKYPKTFSTALVVGGLVMGYFMLFRR